MSLRESIIEFPQYDVNQLDISEEEKNKIVRLNVSCIFSKGKLRLFDSIYAIEVFQEELIIGFNLRRDSTFETVISNRNVGVNVITQEEDMVEPDIKEIVKKYNNHDIAFEENKSAFEMMKEEPVS